MTQIEFMSEVHDYMTHNKADAEKKAQEYNKVAEGFEVVVADFGELGFGLMEKKAALICGVAS